MATKWNGWTRKTRTKIICFILVVVCLIAGSQVAISFIQKDRESYNGQAMDWNLYNLNVTQNEYAYSKLREYLDITEKIALMQSEEYIKQDEHYTMMDDNTVYSLLTGQDYYSDGDMPFQRAQTESVIEFRRFLYTLEQSGLDYYIHTEHNNYGTPNAKNNFYIKVENNERAFYHGDTMDSSQFSANLSDDVTIYLGTNAENYETVKIHMQAYERMSARHLASLCGIGLLGFLALCILVMGTGRRSDDSSATVHMSTADAFPLEFSLGIIILSTVVVLALAERLLSWSFIESYRTHHIFGVLVVIFPCLILVFWLLSLVRHIKNKSLWDNLLVLKIFRGIGKIIRTFAQWVYHFPYKGKSFVYIILAGVAALIIISTPSFVFIFGPLFILFVVFTLHRLDLLKQGVARMEGGDYTQEIPIKQGEFASIARSLENISHNMDAEVSQRLQSELYKTELITNVSHDLRTPLTSLITYTDLLKTKGLDDPSAPEYLEVLIQKSQRLKNLTDDLFEATKAASGNIDVFLEPLNLTELVEQWLGEFDEKILSSNLSFVTTLPPQAPILADGSLMWRVLENLLSNVLKYSMNGTRVYINIQNKSDCYCMEIKNISKFPLNISAEQLMDRFQRGDAARTSEGSGLGLSIVQSFMNAQKGDFVIEVDGDLFKTILCLPKVKDTTSPLPASDSPDDQLS